MPRQTIVVGALVLLGLASAETGFARVPCRDHEPAVCNQIFAPARCVALSVGGKPLRRPLLARGTNACVATDKLRKKACARGLPWRDLAEGEVLCVQLAN